MRRFYYVLLLAFAAPFVSGCGRNLLEMATESTSLGCFGLIILILDVIALIEVFGSDRNISAKVLWGLFIFLCPVVGVVGYYLFGRGQ